MKVEFIYNAAIYVDDRILIKKKRKRNAVNIK